MSTSPAQGQRLAAPPDAVVLAFTQRVAPSSVTVDLRRSSGSTMPTSRLVEQGDLAVRLPMATPLDDGIYVVSWQAVSAVDGHGSSGEFAFAVGDAAGELPRASTALDTDWGTTAASWVFFAGFALATGGLVLRWRGGAAAGIDLRWARTPVRAGLVVAFVGAAAATLLRSAGDEGSRLLSLATVGLIAVAMQLAARTVRPLLPLAAVAGAAATWALRSHSASEGGMVGGLVDFVHLTAGGVWAGALVLVAIGLWRARRTRSSALALVRRYSGLAAVLVVTLGAAGVAGGIVLVPTWSDLIATRYGQLVVAKAALFSVAVALAAFARWRLRRRREASVRRFVAVEVVVAAAALVVAGVLANAAPPRSAGAAEALLGPPPLTGPVARDAGLAGQLNVEAALAADRLQIDVFTGSGPVNEADVHVTMVAPDGTEAELHPRPCGPGCLTQRLQPPPGTSTVQVSVEAPDSPGGTFPAALTWPPGSLARERLAAVVAAMRAAPTVALEETVSSGPGSVVTPHRFELEGARFIDLEPYASETVEDVRLEAGPPPRLRLYLPGSHILVVLELDAHDRIAAARLVTPGHEIVRRFSYPAP